MAVSTIIVDRTVSDLKCLLRVKTEIPVVKFGYEYVTRLITGFRESSVAVNWSLNKVTRSVDQVVKYPYIRDQLLAVDEMLCTSLDLTELNLPVLRKSPYEIYEESIDYVMGVVTPITNWVDVELLPPAEYYIDRYLPELDLDQKIKHVNDGKGSRASQLAVKLTLRLKQHAHAEPKYLGSLMYRGYEETVLLMKILIFDPKLLSKTFLQIWKKLGDSVTPDEAANSLLLVEMGCIKLRNSASSLVQMINITEEIARCYIEIFIRYVNSRKNYIIDNLSRVVNSVTKQQIKNIDAPPKYENIEIKTLPEITVSSKSSTSTETPTKCK